MTPSELRRLRNKPQDNSNLAKISNSLIEAFVSKNNLGALKILFYIARGKIEIDDRELRDIHIDTSSACNYCNIDIKTLKRNLKQMSETSISFIDNKNDITEYISVIPYIKITTKKIELKMFSKILNLIAETKNKFTIIDVENLMQLRSKHSVRMIQLLEMIKGFGLDIPKRKRYLLEDLNGMFGTDYKNIYEFERKILKPVKSELDDKSDLSFTFEAVYEDSVKQGRPSAIGIVIDLIDNQRRQRRFFI